jgi:hypothetical protein
MKWIPDLRSGITWRSRGMKRTPRFILDSRAEPENDKTHDDGGVRDDGTFGSNQAYTI